MNTSLYVVLFLFFLHVLVAEHIYRIEFDRLFPEGIEYHPKIGFLLASGTLGGLWHFEHNKDTQENTVTKFIDPTAPGRGTLGLVIDKDEMVIWVCYVDVATAFVTPRSTFTGVYMLDLNTRQVIREFPMEDRTFGGRFPLMNSITLDSQGRAYATDSVAGQIFHIDPSRNPPVSTFFQSETFFANGSGLNGISYHPNGYLLVIHTGQGVIYRFDVQTKQMQTVQIVDSRASDIAKLVGGDGCYLWGRKRFVVASGASNSLIELRSFDDWRTARITRMAELEMGASVVRVVARKQPFVTHENTTSTKYFAISKPQLKPVF